MKRMALLTIAVAGSLWFAGAAFSHTPLCSCYENGDGTVTCEGGFSDGSSASGVKIRVQDKNGKVMVNGKMDDFSEYTFDKPAGDYMVIFDAGPGHEVEVDGSEITE